MLILIMELLIVQAVIINALHVKHLAQIVYHVWALIEIQTILHARNNIYKYFNLKINSYLAVMILILITGLLIVQIAIITAKLALILTQIA